MASPLAARHIAAETKLREGTARALARLWRALPGYDRKNVDEWLANVVPFVTEAQQLSISLTDAYLAARMRRQPVGVALGDLALRDPAQTYERPFVAVWAALKQGRAFEQAVAAGLSHAAGAAATDVQRAMTGTLQTVGGADDLILGYQRVINPGACELCQAASTQRYKFDDLMPIHGGCGCGVDVIDATARSGFSGKYANDPVIERDGLTVAVREHDELGPVLTNAAHAFSTPS